MKPICTTESVAGLLFLSNEAFISRDPIHKKILAKALHIFYHPPLFFLLPLTFL